MKDEEGNFIPRSPLIGAALARDLDIRPNPDGLVVAPFIMPTYEVPRPEAERDAPLTTGLGITGSISVDQLLEQGPTPIVQFSRQEYSGVAGGTLLLVGGIPEGSIFKLHLSGVSSGAATSMVSWAIDDAGLAAAMMSMGAHYYTALSFKRVYGPWQAHRNLSFVLSYSQALGEAIFLEFGVEILRLK